MGPIRKARQDRGTSLRALATETGINVGQLSRIERGLEGVSIRTLYKVASALDMSDLAEQLKPFVDSKGRIA